MRKIIIMKIMKNLMMIKIVLVSLIMKIEKLKEKYIQKFIMMTKKKLIMLIILKKISKDLMK